MKRNLKMMYKIITLISLMMGIILDILDKEFIVIASYFTLQSNIICLVSMFAFFILEISKVDYKKNGYYIFKGAITIAIFLTMIIYHSALNFNGLLLGGINKDEITSFLLHTLSPILVILDYFLFEVKGNLKLYYPFFWLIIPISYVIYVYVYSYFGGSFYRVGGSVKFAYFFLDYEKIGVWGVAKWMAIIMAFLLGISYMTILYDKKKGKIKKRL